MSFCFSQASQVLTRLAIDRLKQSLVSSHSYEELFSSFKKRDICRRNAGLCKQEPNIAPIQRERERVILRWKYHEDSR